MFHPFMLILVYLMFTVSGSHAQSAEVTAKAGAEIIHLIRKEKLDLILPGALRDNKVDMWISPCFRKNVPQSRDMVSRDIHGHIVNTQRFVLRTETVADSNRLLFSYCNDFRRTQFFAIKDEVVHRTIRKK